jgi:hypothetical protein
MAYSEAELTTVKQDLPAEHEFAASRPVAKRTGGSDVPTAREIIGEQAENDYILDPTAHAALFKDTAPALAALLGRTAVSNIAQQYREADGQAEAARSKYKATMEKANLAVLATAILSAAMMAAQILGDTSPIARWARLICGLASAVAGGLGAMWLYHIRNGNLLENWMGRRATAETMRLSYFTALAAAGNAPDPATDSLKLEYFRRFQYDVQRIYYRVRGRQHREAADFTLRLGGIAVFCSAIAAGVGGLGGATGGISAALGALGVFGAALAAYAGAREAMTQDRRNAERYGRTWDALNGLGGKLDEVRDAVAAGNAAALGEFVAAVNDQISLEHRQWLEGTEATRGALAKLDEALKKPVAQPGQPAAPGKKE